MWINSDKRRALCKDICGKVGEKMIGSESKKLCVTFSLKTSSHSRPMDIHLKLHCLLVGYKLEEKQSLEEIHLQWCLKDKQLPTA